MPSIFTAICSSIKQDNVALFHLIFAVEIAHKKASISTEEKELFS